MAKLRFYFSAMNAGKSTVLLQANHNYQERGMDTILLVPQIASRSGMGIISSRIGLEKEAFPFAEDFDLFSYAQKELANNHNIKCVLVDEAQFINKKQVEQLCRITDELSLPVLAYGLRSDFLGEPFPGSKYLLAWADELIELKTICFCGRKATMNLRIDASGRAVRHGEQVEIGGNDRYVAVCRKHFYEGKTKTE